MADYVTDEIVEAAYRAHPNPVNTYSAPTRSEIRAALEAAAPLIAGRALRSEADRTYTYEFSTGDVIEPIHDETTQSRLRTQADRIEARS